MSLDSSDYVSYNVLYCYITHTIWTVSIAENNAN